MKNLKKIIISLGLTPVALSCALSQSALAESFDLSNFEDHYVNLSVDYKYNTFDLLQDSYINDSANYLLLKYGEQVIYWPPQAELVNGVAQPLVNENGETEQVTFSYSLDEVVDLSKGTYVNKTGRTLMFYQDLLERESLVVMPAKNAKLPLALFPISEGIFKTHDSFYTTYFADVIAIANFASKEIVFHLEQSNSYEIWSPQRQNNNSLDRKVTSYVPKVDDNPYWSSVYGNCTTYAADYSLPDGSKNYDYCASDTGKSYNVPAVLAGFFPEEQSAQDACPTNCQ